MKQLHLKAGPLSMVFEPEAAFLRYVRLGDQEIVRGVFAAIRDRDWNTIPFTVQDLDLQEADDHFSMSFVAKCSQGPIQFEWRGTLTGMEEGVVRYRFVGDALSTFMKNRIGLCVLHPVRECAGQPCRVEHTDGKITDGMFPKGISPHQPFKNIRAITHRVLPGVEARVIMDGEVFEMEDHRNWTDAAYKTYSTPLEIPYPVEIKEGSRIRHTVTIELHGRVPPLDKIASLPATPRIQVDWSRSRPVPHLGFSMATCQEEPAQQVLAHLKELQPDHVRVDLRLQSADWTQQAKEALDLARAIGCHLEVALFAAGTDEPAWKECLALFSSHKDRVARWLVFHPTAKATPAELATAATESLTAFSPAIPVVVGTDIYFTELNRNRPPVGEKTQVCYSINPQVHAFDNLSLNETLDAQRATVESAQELFQRPVVISPITFKPRFNPNATSAAGDAGPAEPPSDERQSTGYAAAWTAGSLAELATHPAVASLTYYETYGPRGIQNAKGNAYPMLAVFRHVRSAVAVSPTTSTHPLAVSAIGLKNADGGLSLLLSNLSDAQQTVEIVVGSAVDLQKVTIDAESVRLVELSGK